MQVEMTQVEPEFPGPRDTEDAVGVGLVDGAHPADLVDGLGVVAYPGVEDAGVLGVGDHQPGRPVR